MTNLSYSELIHHLDLTATDPMVRRLVDMILAGENTVMGELIDIGMDPTTYEFTTDYEELSPAGYIEKLRKEYDYMEQDLEIARQDLEDEQRERQRLETRSVADLLAHMEEIVKRTRADADNVNRQIIKIEQENEQLKEKINVWTIMER